MKKVVVVVLLLLVLPATAFPQSTLWTVASEQGEIYLGGSIHLLREGDYPLPREFEFAYAEAEHLMFEADIAADDGVLQQAVLEHGLLPPGRTLADELSPEVHADLTAWVRQRGIRFDDLQRLRPWLLTLTLSVMELEARGFSSEKGLDQHLEDRARADGKPVSFLETAMDQIEALSALDGEIPDVLVLQFLRDMEIVEDMLDGLIRAWRGGDLEQLEEIVTREIRETGPEAWEALMVNRNRAWLPAIEAAVDSGTTKFVVVGAGHLVGEGNLRDLLEARGYRVERLEVEAIPAD